MADAMVEKMRKLTLWHSRTFTPILSHDELEPIMASIGFVSLPILANSVNLTAVDGGGNSSIVWMEYCFSGTVKQLTATEPPYPRPRLPYPRIDGLHICNYKAFLESVNFYLNVSDDLSNIFHIRGMPLHRINDKVRKWTRMEETDNVVFVYREGTLDLSAYNSYKANKNDLNICSSKNIGYNSNVFRTRGNNILGGCKFVPLKDVIVERSSGPRSKNYNNGNGMLDHVD